MNILLIYPKFPDTFWSFKHALKFIRKKASLPPLGLLTVAAMLPPEWEKRLVDVNVTKLTAGDLEWADYAFVSAMTVQRDSARQIISRCNEAGVKVVAVEPPVRDRQAAPRHRDRGTRFRSMSPPLQRDPEGLSTVAGDT